MTLKLEMTAVGFEPTQLALVELESAPLDHSGKLSLVNGKWRDFCQKCAAACREHLDQESEASLPGGKGKDTGGRGIRGGKEEEPRKRGPGSLASPARD